MKTIAEATPLIPYLVAERVLPDTWYRDPQKRTEWTEYLVTRAEYHFQHSGNTFRRTLMGKDCREYLEMWMKHWVGHGDDRAELDRQRWLKAYYETQKSNP